MTPDDVLSILSQREQTQRYLIDRLLPTHAARAIAATQLVTVAPGAAHALKDIANRFVNDLSAAERISLLLLANNLQSAADTAQAAGSWAQTPRAIHARALAFATEALNKIATDDVPPAAHSGQRAHTLFAADAVRKLNAQLAIAAGNHPED